MLVDLHALAGLDVVQDHAVGNAVNIHTVTLLILIFNKTDFRPCSINGEMLRREIFALGKAKI